MTDLPCTTCTDTARDCATCGDYGAWLAVVDPDPPGCLTCADADWLLLSGETWETTAARLRMQPASLARHLDRCGRDDLLRHRPRGAA